MSTERASVPTRRETMTVNMGPQHPSTHGVLRLVLELSGEVVVSADSTIGFLHTGIEKTAEQKKWQQVIPLVERMDYLGAQSNSLAFSLSVERLLGVEAQMPERVRNIRILIAELQRIASHLVWLGTHALEVGAVSVMMYCFRERELLMNVNEMLAGFRMFPSYIRIGGLREDLPPGFHDAVNAFLARFPSKLNEYEDLLTKNQIWIKRTSGVGALSREDTIAYGLVGPLARAAGVPYDVRKAFPYLGYDTYTFDVPTGINGDVYDRYLVRIEEMRQSLRIAEQAIARITPRGQFDIQDYRIVPAEGGPFAFTADRVRQLEEICGKYPPDRRKSAVLAALYFVQEQQGYLTANAMRHVAEFLRVTPAEVEDVATYYVMFYRAPVGRYVLQVCRTLSCALGGAERVVEALSQKLGIKVGETDASGMFTLMEFECLGAFDRAPGVMVNNEYGPDRLTPENCSKFVDDIKARGEKALSGCYLRVEK